MDGHTKDCSSHLCSRAIYGLGLDAVLFDLMVEEVEEVFEMKLGTPSWDDHLYEGPTDQYLHEIPIAWLYDAKYLPKSALTAAEHLAVLELRLRSVRARLQMRHIPTISDELLDSYGINSSRLTVEILDNIDIRCYMWDNATTVALTVTIQLRITDKHPGEERNLLRPVPI
jgi:hypothetical protein